MLHHTTFKTDKELSTSNRLNILTLTQTPAYDLSKSFDEGKQFDLN